MKHPNVLRRQLAKQWQNNLLRAERLLGNGWPIQLAIGKPSNQDMRIRLDQVRAHIQHWKQIRVGRVIFETIYYRELGGDIAIPTHWEIGQPSDWCRACQDSQVQQEYEQLGQLIRQTHQRYHTLLIRQRSLWRDKPLIDVIRVVNLADQLSPGCAQGKPLRLLANFAIDTKLIERNTYLLQCCLDLRFDNAASTQGLLPFLGASPSNEHWLLIKALDSSLLAFPRLRLSTNALQQQPLPANRLLLIENEQCEHLLPSLDDTIAILGAGRDLNWLAASTLDNKSLYYWGDMDTWGLTLLAEARQHRPFIQALMMNQQVFDTHAADNAVPEPSTATTLPENGLTAAEQAFYQYLMNQPKGRLEQEFLPIDYVAGQIAQHIS